jgi:hypothetical protein
VDNNEKKKVMEKQLRKKITITLTVRELTLLLLIIAILLYAGFLCGSLFRGITDEQDLLTILGYWKTQMDCSKCDNFVCQTTTLGLYKYNLSGLPIKNGS